MHVTVKKQYQYALLHYYSEAFQAYQEDWRLVIDTILRPQYDCYLLTTKVTAALTLPASYICSNRVLLSSFFYNYLAA